MTLLRWRRAVALAGVLPSFFVRLAWLRLQGPLTPARRARWLQSCCRTVLAVLEAEVRMRGAVPARGLVVSNHLSYLDIAVYASVMPCAFVSKAEVGRWPYFGAAARAAGTIFVNRASHASAIAAGAAIRGRLTNPVPILVFPEGTSTDGSRVLRFHSTLFAPAVALGAPVTPTAVRYEFADGAPERELCWYGDDPFLPHLWKTLGAKGVRVEVSFGEPSTYGDRRVAARAAHAEVEAMRAAVCVE